MSLSAVSEGDETIASHAAHSINIVIEIAAIHFRSRSKDNVETVLRVFCRAENSLTIAGWSFRGAGDVWLEDFGIS